MQSLDDEDTSDHEPDAWNGWIKLRWKRLSDLPIFRSLDFWMRRSRKVSGCVTGSRICCWQRNRISRGRGGEGGGIPEHAGRLI
jgi:hypothetical protein